MRIHASIFKIVILVKILRGHHCMVIKSNTIIEKMEYSVLVLVHLQAGTTEIVTLSHYT